jgi:hypothetical protein
MATSAGMAEVNPERMPRCRALAHATGPLLAAPGAGQGRDKPLAPGHLGAGRLGKRRRSLRAAFLAASRRGASTHSAPAMRAEISTDHGLDVPHVRLKSRRERSPPRRGGGFTASEAHRVQKKAGVAILFCGAAAAAYGNRGLGGLLTARPPHRPTGGRDEARARGLPSRWPSIRVGWQPTLSPDPPLPSWAHSSRASLARLLCLPRSRVSKIRLRIR